MTFFANLLFPKTIKSLLKKESDIRSQYYEESRKNEKLALKCKQLEKRHESLDLLLKRKMKFGGRLILIDTSKDMNIYIFNSSSGMIQGFCEIKPNYESDYYEPKFSEIFKVNYRVSGDMFHLIDFYLCGGVPENQGFGTIAMNEIIKVAKTTRCAHIWGELAFIDVKNSEGNDFDIERKERLAKFYSKFGFRITEYKDQSKSMYADIRLELIKEKVF